MHHAATLLGALLTVLLATLASFAALALILAVGEAHRLAQLGRDREALEP